METASPPPADSPALLARLRAGDEAAFGVLVDSYTPSLLRVARGFVPTDAVAEEVVQETWLGVLRGLDAFEERSSLRTWIFRILVNRARTRGERESRTVPFAALAGAEAEEDFSAVDPERFLPADHDQWPHHWAAPPTRWDDAPESAFAHAETLAVVRGAIEALPPAQRLVVLLRDLHGCDADEVCGLLDVTAVNQRVLLHRARSRVRAALEEHLS